MATKTKSKAKVKQQPARKLSKQTRLKELLSFIQLCFTLLEEYRFDQVAEKTGLHPSTIRRIAVGPVSLAIHFGTVQALGYAAGLRLDSTETESKVYLID